MAERGVLDPSSDTAVVRPSDIAPYRPRQAGSKTLTSVLRHLQCSTGGSGRSKNDPVALITKQMEGMTAIHASLRLYNLRDLGLLSWNSDGFTVDMKVQEVSQQQWISLDSKRRPRAITKGASVPANHELELHSEPVRDRPGPGAESQSSVDTGDIASVLEALVAQVGELKETNKALRDEVAALGEQSRRLRTENSALVAEGEGLSAEVKRLETALADAEKRLAERAKEDARLAQVLAAAADVVGIKAR